MTEREMFEKSFERPKNFFKLPSKEQWFIDKILGILDWRGKDLSDEDMKRFRAHYKPEEIEENNQCLYCECVGDLKRCLKTDCAIHNIWLVKELKCHINFAEIL